MNNKTQIELFDPYKQIYKETFSLVNSQKTLRSVNTLIMPCSYIEDTPFHSKYILLTVLQNHIV